MFRLLSACVSTCASPRSSSTKQKPACHFLTFCCLTNTLQHVVINLERPAAPRTVLFQRASGHVRVPTCAACSMACRRLHGSPEKLQLDSRMCVRAQGATITGREPCSAELFLASMVRSCENAAMSGRLPEKLLKLTSSSCRAVKLPAWCTEECQVKRRALLWCTGVPGQVQVAAVADALLRVCITSACKSGAWDQHWRRRPADRKRQAWTPFQQAAACAALPGPCHVRMLSGMVPASPFPETLMLITWPVAASHRTPCHPAFMAAVHQLEVERVRFSHEFVRKH